MLSFVLGVSSQPTRALGTYVLASVCSLSVLSLSPHCLLLAELCYDCSRLAYLRVFSALIVASFALLSSRVLSALSVVELYFAYSH